MRNTKNRSFVLLMCLFIPTLLLAQINVSEKVQLSKTASSSEHALYFIDFWATWCGPCVYASEYLSVLQKQYPDQFYVVSLSEENADKVKRFVKKRPTELAVFVDYNGETFKKYSIRSLPYGVVLNAKGKVVWKGSPADFKPHDLKRIAKQNRNKIALDELFVVLEDVNQNNENQDYIPTKDFEFMKWEGESFETLQVDEKQDYIDIKGGLQDILAYALKVHTSQIEIQSSSDSQYHVFVKKNTVEYTNILSAILNAFNLQMTQRKVNGPVLSLTINHPTFWDTHQIDWGKNAPHYLIDDLQLQGDNVSLADIMYQLGILLELPVVSQSTINASTRHDWQMHYKFFELMQSELLDTYGIQAEKKNMPFDSYIFDKKKTP